MEKKTIKEATVFSSQFSNITPMALWDSSVHWFTQILKDAVHHLGSVNNGIIIKPKQTHTKTHSNHCIVA